MAMELFQIFGRIGLNGVDEVNDQLGQTTSNAHNSSNKMVSAFKKIGAAVGTYFAVDKIKNFGKACVDAAADVAAENAAFEQIMGDYASEAQAKLDKVASATGITSSRMTGYMTSLSAKFKGLGYGVEDATSLAARGMNLVADGAAFWDMSLDETTSHLNSFINGSYEGGEAIGLFANDTQMATYAVEQGIIKDTKAWANLDEATKQATRLEYAENMYALSGATGQAAKESDAYLNVQGELTEAWRQFKSAIGEPILNNIVLPAMQMLSGLLPTLTEKVGPLSEKFVKFITDAKECIEEIVIYAFVPFKEKLNEVREKLQPLIDKIKELIQNFTGGKKPIDLIRIACYALESVIDWLGDALIVAADELMKFVSWLEGGSDGAEAFKAIIIGITAAFAAYKAIMLAHNVVMAAMAIKTKAVAVAQGILNAVMSANPIALVVIAVAALTAAFVYLWNHCEGFRNFWIGLWEDIKTIAGNVGEWFETAWTNIVAWFKTAWTNVSAWFTGAWNSISEWFKGAWEDVSAWFQSAWNSISAWFTGAVQSVTDWFKTAWQDVSNFFTSLWEGIKSFFSAVWDGISNSVSVAWDWISEKISTGANAVSEFVTNAFNALSEFVTTCWNGISEGISVAWDWISEKVTEGVNAVSEVVNTVFTAVSEFVTTCWNGISEGISVAWEAIKEFVSSAINSVSETVTNIFNSVSSFVSDTWNNIKSSIESPINDAKDTVTSVVDGIKSGVTEAFDGIKNKATEVWDSIKSAIQNPIEDAKNFVGNAIDSIKGFFNFEFKWPKLTLPHFSFSGSWNPFDWPDQFPSLGIEWYAKGGVLNSPTLFGISPTGKAMVGGEDGAEAVAPIDTLMSYVSAAVKNETDDLNYNIQKLISMLSDYMPQIVSGIDRPLVLDTGAIVGGIARNMDGKLGDINRMKGRGN